MDESFEWAIAAFGEILGTAAGRMNDDWWVAYRKASGVARVRLELWRGEHEFVGLSCVIRSAIVSVTANMGNGQLML